jgi:UDPglucose 6-dehydrogenase
MRIGVIGHGVVGGALAKGFSQLGHKVFVYDKHKPAFLETAHLFSTVAIFICVPTPTDTNGQQDLSAIDETFQMLKTRAYDGVIVVKSTVLPGTTVRLADKYGFRRVVHNPEFLTAASPFEDFMNLRSEVLIGGIDGDAGFVVVDIYKQAGFQEIVYAPSPLVTEMAKYMHNLFLAAKVTWCNEMAEACEKLGIRYDTCISLAIGAGGIGRGHTKVPGPDGQLGYGGMCFPKDTKAFLNFATQMGLPMEMLRATITGNTRRRP